MCSCSTRRKRDTLSNDSSWEKKFASNKSLFLIPFVFLLVLLVRFSSSLKVLSCDNPEKTREKSVCLDGSLPSSSSGNCTKFMLNTNLSFWPWKFQSLDEDFILVDCEPYRDILVIRCLLPILPLCTLTNMLLTGNWGKDYIVQGWKMIMIL